MQLHQVQPKTKNKRKAPRVGRGGKRGTYSGRGQKGQKSRSGHKIRPAVYDFIGRLPKLRGFKNKPIGPKAKAVNLGDLNKVKGDAVSRQTLVEAGIIRKNDKEPVKILGRGEPGRAFKVDGLAASKSAKEKIERAGGSIK